MASNDALEFQMNPLQEQWPNIRFMGLGAWWAWIWLCYGSTVVMNLFPIDVRPERVFEMYALSTPTIAFCMILAALFSDKVEAAMEQHDRALCYCFACFASLTTLTMELSGLFNSVALFVVSAALTGVGTSYLCLRAGKLYGSVGLAESLTAGTISLIFAGLLYFMGVALPGQLGPLFAAAMPLVAGIMLSMEGDDSFAVVNSPKSLADDARKVSMRALRSVSIAGGLIALTAGLGKGVSSIQVGNDAFAEQGILGTLLIVIIGILILIAINKKGAVFAITNAYTALIVMGIAVMIGMCFGLPSAYLTVGKEALWLVLSVLLAYLAFRYSISPVRVFGAGQAAYFFCSTAGWLIGHAAAPYYDDFTVSVGISLAMVFAIVLAVLYILPTWRVKHIVQSGRTVHYATPRTTDGFATPVAEMFGAVEAPSRVQGAYGSVESEHAAGVSGIAEASGAAEVARVARTAGVAGASAVSGTTGAARVAGAAGAESTLGDTPGDASKEDTPTPVSAYTDNNATAEAPAQANTEAWKTATSWPSANTKAWLNVGAWPGSTPDAAQTAGEAAPEAAPSFDYGRAADPLYGLSARELEIMALFAQGRSANWIAENQCISKNTVRTHLRSVYAKLDVHTRQELLDFIAGK